MPIPRCPHCDADLRQTGVREYGFVAFEISLAWDADSGFFEMRDQPRYGDCSSLDWQCPSCEWDLPEHPDELA